MIVTKRGISGLIVEIIICIALHFWIENSNLNYSAWIVQINVVILILAIQQVAIMKFATGKLLHCIPFSAFLSVSDFDFL